MRVGVSPGRLAEREGPACYCEVSLYEVVASGKRVGGALVPASADPHPDLFATGPFRSGGVAQRHVANGLGAEASTLIERHRRLVPVVDSSDGHSTTAAAPVEFSPLCFLDEHTYGYARTQ